eukprot:587962_1
MATSADQLNAAHLTQLLILNLGSRNACMRALVAHPTDLNAAANWLINHRTDANIDTDPFAAQPPAAQTQPTNPMTTYHPPAQHRQQPQPQQTQHTQQHMIQQVMNLGYSRDEALRAYTNVSTTDRQQTNKLVDYLVKNPKKAADKDKKTYNTYSSSNYSSYYPYSSSNKKKVYRPVINIDDIKVEKEEICDISECECLEHIGIILREYKKFLIGASDETFTAKACAKGKDYESNGFYAYFMDTISGDGEYTLSDVMDDLIHVIAKHDIRYGEFSKVFSYIIGSEALNGVLDVNTFDLMRRCVSCDDLSDVSAKYYGFKSVKEISAQQICDKIYCALVCSARLNKSAYRALDKKYGIAEDAQDDNGFVKEKSISSYVGCKQYREYKQLLDAKNGNDKFHYKLNVERLETRVDPKELKIKLAKEKRERLREEKRKEEQIARDKGNEEDEGDKGKEEGKEATNALDDSKEKEIKEIVKDKGKEEDEGDKGKEEKEVINKGEYSIGVRYNYWAHDMEDLIGISVDCADALHKTLREELMDHLSELEYHVLSEKAQIYFDTEHCQETIEAGVNSFGIALLDKITVDHIMAMMVYCNYDAIRHALDATYVRKDGDETDAQLMRRHAHLYHLGKLLRESVECYGVEAHQSESKAFYHGMKMNDAMMSDVHALFMYPPFSSSSCMEMCMQSDLIIELKGYVSKYFDCWWISEMCVEREQIFCGGTRALSVSKCINTKYGFDHKLLMHSFEYIPQLFVHNEDGVRYDDMLQETKQTIRNLLFYQLNMNRGDEDQKYPQNLDEYGIPSAIRDKLNAFCVSTKRVRMHYDAMYNHRAFGFLSSLFMTPTRTFAQLDVIQQLFPQLDSFVMVRAPLTTLTFLYIKSIIHPTLGVAAAEEDEKDDHKEGLEVNIAPQIAIRTIEIIRPKTDAMSIAAVIQSEERSLAQLQWTIESPDKDRLVLKYSDVPVVIKEPTPPPQPKPVLVEKEEKKEEQPIQKKKRRKKVKRKVKKQPQPGATNEPSNNEKQIDAAKQEK